MFYIAVLFFTFGALAVSFFFTVIWAAFTGNVENIKEVEKMSKWIIYAGIGLCILNFIKEGLS